MTSNFPNDLPSYFADAEASFDDSDIVLFGAPYDRTSSFRPGARFGPETIRKASWNFEPYNIITGVNIKNCKVHDYGNISITQKDTPKEVFGKVTQFTQEVKNAGKIPFLLGGEHTLSAASVHGFEKELITIIFDAHLDFRDEYVNERFNHACTIRRINDVINGEQIFVLGFRSADSVEVEDAKKAGVHMFTSETILNQGIDTILSSIRQEIIDKPVYLSIDIDVLDPSFAPGTGSLEPFGLSPREILRTINFFSSEIKGFDIMEVAPSYDTGQTSILAAKLVRYAMEIICKNK
jgi:agmatinase